MYDWANSVHGLVIVSSIFPVYFAAVARGSDGSDMISFFGFMVKNSVLFSYSVSASFLIIALMIPLCTALADFLGRKKLFMQIFCYLGSLSCILLYFFTRDTLEISVLVFMVSLIGWSGSIVFYNSFLPDIATEDNFDRYSARGYAYGYVGSVLLMLFNLSMILNPGWYGITDGTMPARISFLSVGVWWMLFAQIPFRYLEDYGNIRMVKEGHSFSWVLQGFRGLKSVWEELRGQIHLKRYLMAYFVFSTGVQTVMYVATIFGSVELRLPESNLILTILIIQLIAVPGSYFFSGLSGRVGNVYALMAGVTIWIGICFGAYYVSSGNEFYVLAVVVGFVMGGIQALSRATYSKLIPDDAQRTASYFSFYDVTEKLSIVAGTLMYGYIEQVTGSMRNSILALLLVFVAGLFLLSRIPSQKIYGFKLSEHRK